MTDTQPIEREKFRKGNDGLYVVMLGDERIGLVRQEADGRWKAVDTYMEWTSRYKTRARAGLALLRRYRKAQP